MQRARRAGAAGVTGVLALLLAACGGTSQVVVPPAHPVSLGATIAQAEQFFETQGGGGWSHGPLTGGTVGLAGGNGQQRYCPALIGGSRKVSNIYVFCQFAQNSIVTPSQAQTLLSNTVAHFVPSAASWAQQTLSQSLASQPLPKSKATKVFGQALVEIQTTPAPGSEVTVSIRAA